MSPLKNRIQEAIDDLSADRPNQDDHIRQSGIGPAAAFERDMQPVCKAVADALQAGDMDALRGLRGLFPHLLREVNAAPELADVLAHQLGAEILKGFTAKPEASV